MRRIRNAGKQEKYFGLQIQTRLLFLSCLPAFLIFDSSSLAAKPIVIGSKKFTESYVLSEIAKRKLEDAGLRVEHRQGMGGTIILWQALRSN